MRRVLIGCLSAALAAGVPLFAASALPLDLEDPLTGGPVKIEAGPGVLHVVLFATWCPPCRAELDGLADIEARFKDRGYRLVLVAVQNRHTGSRLARFVADDGPPGRLLFDADGAGAKRLGGDDLPTHVLFDADGNELWRATALDAAALEERLGRALQRRGAGR